jgi:hypothetical protein
MPKPNMRLTDKDNLLIRVVQKKMEKLGFIDPTATDAVRFALGKVAK